MKVRGKKKKENWSFARFSPSFFFFAVFCSLLLLSCLSMVVSVVEEFGVLYIAPLGWTKEGGEYMMVFGGNRAAGTGWLRGGGLLVGWMVARRLEQAEGQG